MRPCTYTGTDPIYFYLIQALAPQLIAIHALQRRQRSVLEVSSLNCGVGTKEIPQLEPLVFRDAHGIGTQITNGEEFTIDPEATGLSRQEEEHL